jgi:RNA polymerase primary sigma factor
VRQFKITDRITLKGSRSSVIYRQEVEKTKLLDPNKEAEVALKASKGDKEATDLLVKSNRRFVLSVAKMYSRDEVVIDELIQAGNIGLLEAAGKFDPSRGFKFISFAVWYIRKEMIEHLANNSRLVRLPVNKSQLTTKIREAQSAILTREGREGSDEEIIEYLQSKNERLAEGITPEMLRIVMQTDFKAYSFDQPMTEDGDSSNLYEVYESKDAGFDQEHTGDHNRWVVEHLMERLTPHERYLMREINGIGCLHEGRTIRDLADEFEVTTETIRGRVNKAMRKMKVLARSMKVNGDL